VIAIADEVDRWRGGPRRVVVANAAHELHPTRIAGSAGSSQYR
jgi:hypothetical protein